MSASTHGVYARITDSFLDKNYKHSKHGIQAFLCLNKSIECRHWIKRANFRHAVAMSHSHQQLHMLKEQYILEVCQDPKVFQNS